MARCRYCGNWAGLFSSEHDGCRLRAKRGPRYTDFERIRNATSLPPEVQQSLTVTDILVFGFGAICCLVIIATIIYSFVSTTLE